MQANCSSCGQKITIDDAKVPDRAFQVKCPKCQTIVKFPGKGSAEAAPVEASGAAPSEEVRAQMIAQIRREISLGDPTAGGRALVALPDKGHAGNITLTLSRQGYQVDTIDDFAEGGRLLEQGVFDVVVTARMALPLGKGESLYQRLMRLSPEMRRRVFVILVGDEFKTGDGTQAWSCLGDLVVNSKDAGSADAAFRNIFTERQRLYQAYLDARKRQEMAG